MKKYFDRPQCGVQGERKGAAVDRGEGWVPTPEQMSGTATREVVGGLRLPQPKNKDHRLTEGQHHFSQSENLVFSAGHKTLLPYGKQYYASHKRCGLSPNDVATKLQT